VTNSPAVQQAVQLLQMQLAEITPRIATVQTEVAGLSQRLAELMSEKTEIEKALRQLGAPTKPSAGAKFLEIAVEVLAVMSDNASVRQAVQTVLEQTPRALEQNSIVEALAPRFQRGRTDEQFRSAVRTALWQLREKQIVIGRSDGTHIATKWVTVDGGRAQVHSLPAKS
jgi:chromosome segregation ATPase